MNDQTLDRRLTTRVHNIWKRHSKTGFPRRSQIDPRDFGTDWANCLMIDLDPDLSKSRFSYVGRGLQDPTWPTFDRQMVTECLEGTLLELLARQVPQVIAKKKPVSNNGAANHDGGKILYRTILMPLSESGKKIDGVLMAINYREVATIDDVPSPEAIVSDRAGRATSAKAARHNGAAR